MNGVSEREFEIVLSQSKLRDAIPQVLRVISNLNWTVHESKSDLVRFEGIRVSRCVIYCRCMFFRHMGRWTEDKLRLPLCCGGKLLLWM